MRYDDMIRLHPWLKELFASVQDMGWKGRRAADIMEQLVYCDLRIRTLVQERHQPAVLKKLEQWARVVDANSLYLQQHPPPQRPPNPCPVCGSIETRRGRCGWCGEKA